MMREAPKKPAMRENSVAIGSYKQPGPELVPPGPGAMAQGRGKKQLPFWEVLSPCGVLGPVEAQLPGRQTSTPPGWGLSRLKLITFPWVGPGLSL